MSKKGKKVKRQVSTAKINAEVMPIANEIRSKMEMLSKKYNFKIDFAFPEITPDEILRND